MRNQGPWGSNEEDIKVHLGSWAFELVAWASFGLSRDVSTFWWEKWLGHNVPDVTQSKNVLATCDSWFYMGKTLTGTACWRVAWPAPCGWERSVNCFLCLLIPWTISRSPWFRWDDMIAIAALFVAAAAMDRIYFRWSNCEILLCDKPQLTVQFRSGSRQERSRSNDSRICASCDPLAVLQCPYPLFPLRVWQPLSKTPKVCLISIMRCTKHNTFGWVVFCGARFSFCWMSSFCAWVINGLPVRLSLS